MPRTVTIDDSEIREALSECVATILNAIRIALERTPPELSADIIDRGIVLTGGATSTGRTVHVKSSDIARLICRFRMNQFQTLPVRMFSALRRVIPTSMPMTSLSVQPFVGWKASTKP